MKDRDLEAHARSRDPVRSALARELLRLRRGLRRHRRATGHALCWENDLALWRLIEPGARYPHETLPVRGEFLGRCRLYYASRLAGTPYAEPRVRRAVRRIRGA